MDKKAVVYAVAALVIILVVALVIKPIATGHPLNTGFSLPTPPETMTVAATPVSEGSHLSIPVTTATTAVPTTVPTWDNKIKKVGVVDPSTYGISMNPLLPNGTKIDPVVRNTTRIIFANLSGQYSTTTQIFHIPFPYWEIWYSVEPAGKTGGKDQKLSSSTATGPQDSSKTVIQGSFSVTTPRFTLDVMDAADPNRIVRTITPPGGLDASLWTVSDPRPWKEKFYEGQKDYYFVINTQSLSSYSLEIRIPAEYLGKY
jgi:hypothetical protein